MKNFKLWVYQRGANEDELIIHPNDFPDVSVGDIVEIYHSEESNRLLLQVKSLKADSQQKEIVTIDQTVASIFKLRQYKEVVVNKVKEQDVALGLVELLFKDQYISRSDMLRLKKCMLSTCAYISKKVEICGIRAQVNELWAKGDKVTCGAITEDTKISFRSSKAMCYLFVQMSSEMWEFDSNGNLYWEKAVNGFLKDLFTLWKQQNTNNEVTIVFFSRRFYNAQSIDEFPESMRACLHKDYKGLIYEDFYKVIVQNERREDWLSMLITLKQHFIQYLDLILPFQQGGMRIPSSCISTAAEGNFLESLNMSLNIYDKHYIDRNFDRTGQLVIMITAGAGVFEVDRELCNLTKQRMIDYGINTDIICMAEQPLHATLLFRFHSKSSDNYVIGDDYNIPHWINHSFYTSINQRKTNSIGLSNFTPRIKLAERLPGLGKSADQLPALLPSTGKSILPSEGAFDSWAEHYYDEHDDNVFKMPSRRTSKSDIKSVRSQFGLRDSSVKERFKIKRKLYKSSVEAAIEAYDAPSGAIPIPGRARLITYNNRRDDGNVAHSEEDDNEDLEGLPQRVIVGSASAIHCPQNISPSNTRIKRALVNPFAQSCSTIRLTSNRRRWTHTFPQGPSGEAMQLHHRRRDITECSDDDQNFMLELSDSGSGRQTEKIPHSSSGVSLSSQVSVSSTASVETVQYRGPNNQANRGRSGSFAFQLSPGNTKGPFCTSVALMFGATGDHVWSPFIQTGVDWKSITATACLPVTTDFYPDNFILERDYMENQYNVSPDALFGSSGYSLEAAFTELVSQRLRHGFQMVISPPFLKPSPHQKCYRTSQHLITNVHRKDYVLSIGNIFHRVAMNTIENAVTVTMFKPRHPFVPREFFYAYKLWPAMKSGYEVASVEFYHEQVGHFNWNYMDNYICCKGVDYDLMESLKYWRTRFLLLPLSSHAVRTLCESPGEPCDNFKLQTESESQQLTEGFLKFMDILNRIRRQNNITKNPNTHPKRFSVIDASLCRSIAARRASLPPPRPSSSFRGIEKHTHRRLDSTDYSADTLQVPVPTPVTPTNNNIADNVINRPLQLCSPLEYISRAMMKPESGLHFLPSDAKGFPNYSFVGVDAMQWIMQTLEGDVQAYEALELLHTMVAMKLIHSVCEKHKKWHFNGYYFFYLQTEDQNENNAQPSILDSSLHKYLFQVGIVCNSNKPDNPSDIPSFLLPWNQDTHDFDTSKTNDKWGGRDVQQSFLANEDCSSHLFKSVILDLSHCKVDREEWCHVAYQQNFNPSQSFEMKVQWLVSSTSILNELIQGWARKANQCGFHLVPVPCDPFHFRLDASDPLTSPLFIELNVQALLVEDNLELFEFFEADSQLQRMNQLQAAILQRFGFIPMSQASEDQYESLLLPLEYSQFVHISGGAFAAIRCTKDTKPVERILHHNSPFRRSHSHQHVVDHSNTLYKIYRKDSYNTQQKQDLMKNINNQGKTGFLWMTNHLLTKRWRSLGSGCEKFPTRLLTDFTHFCSDGHGRLKTFWDMLQMS